MSNYVKNENISEENSKRSLLLLIEDESKNTENIAKDSGRIDALQDENNNILEVNECNIPFNLDYDEDDLFLQHNYFGDQDEDLKFVDFKNDYNFDPNLYKKPELDMAQKLVYVIEFIDSEGIENEEDRSIINDLKWLVNNRMFNSLLYKLKDSHIDLLKEALKAKKCESEEFLKQMNYLDEFEDLDYLYLENVTPSISIAELYKIVQQELLSLKKFINLDDKEYGLLPAFFNGRCYEIDTNKRVLSEVVQFIASKIIDSSIILLFDRALDMKIKNSLDFSNSVAKEVCSNYAYIFDTISEDEFDNVPHEINTPKGILNLKTLTYRNRNITDYNLHCTNSDFLPDYRDEPFEFTDAIWDVLSINANSSINTLNQGRKNYEQINKDRFDSYMRIYGYLLTGEVMEKKVFIECGDSNTGKSTRHKIVSHLLGSYAGSCSVSSLIRSKRTNNDIRPEFVKLRNKRLIISAEPSEKDVLDEKLLKSISGGDAQSFRKPHSGVVVTSIPRSTMLISSNYIPQISPLDDKAFYNRLVMIETKGELANTRMNPHYFEMMTSKEMGDKIFTFLCHYAHYYYVDKELYIDDSFRMSKDLFYLKQKDSVSMFFETCVQFNDLSIANHDQQRLMVNDLYNLFKAFLMRMNISDNYSRIKFIRRFQEIAECFGIEKQDHDPKHGVYYDQIQVCVYNNPRVF